MEKKVFAPVLIPTLNRFEHFKRCVESLSKCTHSDQTELVIGIDYPPADKYFTGWRQIKEYVPLIKGFKKVTVFNRDNNLGPAENIQGLKIYARKHYDRFIFSEDDNEFAPNFLDYMNKGLEAYNDNPKVFGICGYNYYKLNMSSYNKEYYFSHEMSAWGYGSWFNDKCDTLWETIRKPDYLITMVKEVPFRVFLKNNTRLCNALGNVGYDFRGDAYITYYQRLNDLYCVFPTISMVRNHGHDGSGLHSGNLKGRSPYSVQLIDTRLTFDSTFDQAISVDKKLIKQIDYLGPRVVLRNIIRLGLLKVFVKI